MEKGFVIFDPVQSFRSLLKEYLKAGTGSDFFDDKSGALFVSQVLIRLNRSGLKFINQPHFRLNNLLEDLEICQWRELRPANRFLPCSIVLYKIQDRACVGFYDCVLFFVGYDIVCGKVVCHSVDSEGRRVEKVFYHHKLQC